MGDSDEGGVLRGELAQPTSGLADPSDLQRRRVCPTETHEQSSTTDGHGPPDEWKSKPAELGALEGELSQEWRRDDRTPGGQ